MPSPKTEKGLTQLLALSVAVQNMPDEHLVAHKFGLSMAMQEVVVFLADAHGLDSEALAMSAIEHLGAAARTASVIAKAAGKGE